jgi:uncharacterized protein YdeI (YjbR/CyaY-like superfamily)
MKTEKGTDVPDDLLGVLEADQEALRVFQTMRPSCQREYVQWITEAKKHEARARRLSGAVTRIREYGARHGLLDTEQRA